MRFRLTESTSVEDFAALNERFQTEFMYQQTGLRRRTVAQDLNGQWLVLTIWTSKADVHHAEHEAAQSPVAQQFAACIEPSSTSLEYFKERSG